jgi:hypothetical protein
MLHPERLVHETGEVAGVPQFTKRSQPVPTEEEAVTFLRVHVPSTPHCSVLECVHSAKEHSGGRARAVHGLVHTVGPLPNHNNRWETRRTAAL